MSEFLFTSESVSMGHPDKVSDQISDGILDALIAVDPTSRVACETLCTTDYVQLSGEITSAGACVSIGHVASTANFDACVEAGATLATHLFNTMGGLHHREDGVAPRVLDEGRLAASLIADGHHVGDTMLRNAWRILGPERTILVTDSVAAAAQPDGEYLLGGLSVTKSGGTVRTPEGALAGSTLVMSDAVHHAQATLTDLSPVDIARLTSGNPARLLGDDSRGSLSVGAQAEFSLLGADGKLCSL